MWIQRGNGCSIEIYGGLRKLNTKLRSSRSTLVGIIKLSNEQGWGYENEEYLQTKNGFQPKKENLNRETFAIDREFPWERRESDHYVYCIPPISLLLKKRKGWIIGCHCVDHDSEFVVSPHHTTYLTMTVNFVYFIPSNQQVANTRTQCINLARSLSF